MTPNLNANPLATLNGNTTTTTNGIHTLPETAGLAPVDGLDTVSGKPVFSDILQTLEVPTADGEALFALQLAGLGAPATKLTGISFAAATETVPVNLPGTVAVQMQQTLDGQNGASPPDGGKALPPTLREALSQLQITQAGEASTPGTVPSGPAATLALPKTPHLTYQGPIATATSLPVEPAAMTDAISELVKLQKLKAAQHQPVGPLSAASVGNDTSLTAAEANAASADLVRLATTASDKASLQPPAIAALPLSRPAGTPGWDQALGQRVLWMVDNGLGQAELRLDPPHLGSVNVRITMRDDQAQVLFQAVHPAARDALEAALPRLREMFADQGLQLGSADVGSQDGEPTGESGRDRADGETAKGAFDTPLKSAEGEAQSGTGTDSPLPVRSGEYLLVDEFV